jgi:hypothetical protein
METPFEDSLMARYLSKEVHESVVLDDMETDRGWQVTGIGEMAYTAEFVRTGRRSLELRIPMRDEEHLAAHRKDGSLSIGQGGYAAATLPLDPPQDWSGMNRISLWVYVQPTCMHSYSFHIAFSCEGVERGPVTIPPAHFIQDLEPGRWNHVVWEIPEVQRDRVTSFSICQTLRGHGPEEGGVVVYNIDRIDLERVDCEPYRGWEPAPGRIALNHVGYHPTGPKLALTSGTGADEFEVVDARSGQAVARFPVQRMNNERGSFEMLDFGAFTAPGRYFLRCGESATRAFEIAEDVWFGTIDKVLNAYYGLRCGFPVPGVHGVCHGDLQGRRDDMLKVVNGGWHDAGDLSQGSHRTGASVYSMLRIYEELRARDLAPELRERLIEEAGWGLDWLLKTRFGDGYRITWALGRIYTDNEIGTVDDVVVPARHIAFENFLFAAVAAYAARVLADSDADRAAECLSAAQEDHAATLDARDDWSDATRDEAAFGALASVELYRATGREQYADEAARFGRLLVQCQEQTFVDGIPIAGYFYRDVRREQVVHDHHLSFEGAPLLALEALCDALPDHEEWVDWYGAALLHSEFFLARGSDASSPYCLVPNSVWSRDEIEAWAERWREEGRDPAALIRQYDDGTALGDSHRLRVFPIWRDHLFHGNTAIQLSGTLALSAAARLRNSAPLQGLVGRQLQWVCGGNPFSQSLMYGEGYDFQPHFAYCLRDLVGALPVGMDSRANDEPWWPAQNNATYKEIWVVPMSRFLWSLAYTAVPARVTGEAAAGATFTDVRSGAEVSVSGPFSVNLPPGTHALECGAMHRKLELLAGVSYELILDPADWIEIGPCNVTEDPGGCIRIEAIVRGAGEHELEARLFNGATDAPRISVALGDGGEGTVSWDLRIECDHKPWAAVIVPDGNVRAGREVIGSSGDPASCV